MKHESIYIKRTNSNDPDFRKLIPMLDAELLGLYESRQSTYDTLNVIDYTDTVVTAYDNDMLAGCGCFKKFDDDSIEIKRMYVRRENRGKGIAESMLKELEKWAAELHYSQAVLETGINQPQAIRLYEKMGYSRIQKYGAYIDLPDSACMKKSLTLVTEKGK